MPRTPRPTASQVREASRVAREAQQARDLAEAEAKEQQALALFNHPEDTLDYLTVINLLKASLLLRGTTIEPQKKVDLHTVIKHAYKKIGKFQEALEHQQIVNSLPTSMNVAAATAAAVETSDLLFKLGRYKDALETMTPALRKYARALGGIDHPMLAINHAMIGACQHKLGLYDAAHKEFTVSLEMSIRLGKSGKNIYLRHVNLGHNHSANGQAALAIDHFSKALTMLSVDQQKGIIGARLQADCGNAAFKAHDFAVAANYLAAAASTLRGSEGYGLVIAEYINMAGSCYSNAGMLDKAKSCYDQSIQLLHAAGRQGSDLYCVTMSKLVAIASGNLPSATNLQAAAAQPAAASAGMSI